MLVLNISTSNFQVLFQNSFYTIITFFGYNIGVKECNALKYFSVCLNLFFFLSRLFALIQDLSFSRTRQIDYRLVQDHFLQFLHFCHSAPLQLIFPWLDKLSKTPLSFRDLAAEKISVGTPGAIRKRINGSILGGIP